MESPLAIFCSQVSLPVDGMGCIQLSCWLSGSRRNPQTAQADAKAQGCFLVTARHC